MAVKDQHDIQVQNGDVVCDIDFLTPGGLSFRQTDQYDPNPEPQITLREWHLTAETAEKMKEMEFVTVYRPHRTADEAVKKATLETIVGKGYVLTVGLSDGEVVMLLPIDQKAELADQGLSSKGAIKCRVRRAGREEIVGLDE
jgi:hypothetical protein